MDDVTFITATGTRWDIRGGCAWRLSERHIDNGRGRVIAGDPIVDMSAVVVGRPVRIEIADDHGTWPVITARVAQIRQR